MKIHRKYVRLIIILIAMPAISHVGYYAYRVHDQKNNYIFWGSPRHDEFTKDYAMSKTEAEQYLMTHLVENELSYRPFPYQVVMADDGGYLFIDDEFKLYFGIQGYRVSSSGEVKYVDYDTRFNMKYYDGNKDRSNCPRVHNGKTMY